LGLRSREQLEQKEAEYAAKREVESLRRAFRKTFDLDHLRSLHRWLFQDVYEWAGDLRKVVITKGDSTFAFPQHIEAQARLLFDDLRAESALRHIALKRCLFGLLSTMEI
jgi:cell filamentation protein